MKKRVLLLADSPTCITGFGKVAKHICKSLHDTGLYDITVVGINYDGYPPHHFPYNIIPATSALVQKYSDLYGRRRTMDLLLHGDFDIFFCIQDMGVTASFMPEVAKVQQQKKDFVSILYTPVDSQLITQPKWITDGAETFDFIVTYTEYGKKQINAVKTIDTLDICPHGCELEDFFPVDPRVVKDFRKSCISHVDLTNRFVVLNVNRNQIRKDYLHTFKAFAELKKMVPCAFLFVLAQLQDQGGNLLDIATQCGLKYGDDWYAPDDYVASSGYDVKAVNMLYNMADVVFSSTVGEGWGLSTAEAGAVGTPCVFPDNTSLHEIFGGGDRGYLIPSGDNPDRFVCYALMDSSLVRPTIDTVAAAKLLKRVFDNPQEANEKAKKMRQWVEEHTWDKVNQFWVDKFAKVSEEVDRRKSYAGVECS